LKILFDEDVPAKLTRSLPRHEIHTVVSMQWGGIKNGALLVLIERERFDVFLTGDKNMDKQQRLEGRMIRSGSRVALCPPVYDDAPFVPQQTRRPGVS
jgi:hypothetical protein